MIQFSGVGVAVPVVHAIAVAHWAMAVAVARLAGVGVAVTTTGIVGSRGGVDVATLGGSGVGVPVVSAWKVAVWMAAATVSTFSGVGVSVTTIKVGVGGGW